MQYNKPHKNAALYIIRVRLCIMEILDNEHNRSKDALLDWDVEFLVEFRELLAWVFTQYALAYVRVTHSKWGGWRVWM